MARIKRINDDKRSFKKSIAFLVVICLLVGVACLSFYNQVDNTVQEESEHYLREISNRISSNVTRIIDDNMAALTTIKNVVEGLEGKSFEDLHAFLERQISLWDFTSIILIDDSGVAYDLDGTRVTITGDSFLRNFSLSEEVIAPTQIINNEEKTVFSTPLSNVVLDGIQMTAIATLYEPEQFDRILSMTSFDKQAYSYIVSTKGNVVVRSSTRQQEVFGYNVIQTLEDNDPKAIHKINQIENEIKEGISGQKEVTVGKSKEYLVYTPLEISDWVLFSFIPVSVVNAKSTMLLQSTAFMTGLIFIVFTLFITVLITSFNRNRKQLEEIAYVDPLTKGHTIQKFYQLCQECLNNPNGQYVMIYTNIQRFKVLNDQFGRAVCDELLVNMHNAILSTLHEDEVIAHQSADNFVVLMKYTHHKELEEKFTKWDETIKQLAGKLMEVIPMYTIEYGVYILEDYTINVVDMIDRTKLALRNGSLIHKKDDHIRYAYYNEDVRRQLILEKNLEDRMEYALEKNEFKAYLQPKYKTGTHLIAGAEALVRWDSQDSGMIYPNDFIPLFEKNGFIIKLDLWMFDQVCQMLQKWQDVGKELIPISVNCSRAHLKNPAFLEAYIEVYKKYSFPAHYLELEFTENMVFEETERLAKIIDHIHEVGFECSMDDFGSGYSSLNLLQDIHVDTLKLDRVFFKKVFNESARTKAIISCVLDMAQALKMKTVAEGIEEWEQVDALGHLGCDYIQGYVYAKPMPMNDFENLLFDKQEGEL